MIADLTRLACLFFLAISLATATTPPPLGPPYWAWSPVTYEYTSSLPLQAMTWAASGWGQLGIMSFNVSYGWLDVRIYDDNSLSPQHYALTYHYSQALGTCWKQKDTCGRCMDWSVMYYAIVKVNANTVRSVAQQFNINLTNFSTNILSHELGHVLGLQHVTPVAWECWEVDTVMYNGAITATKDCGVMQALMPSDWYGLLNIYTPPVLGWCPCLGQSCN